MLPRPNSRATESSICETSLIGTVESQVWRARKTPAAAVKRGIDIVVGSLLALVSLPIIAVLAVVAAVHFHAWPFFTQARLGKDGAEFTIIKIRSLPKVTNPYVLKSALEDLDFSWFSRFLRTTNLDELPQLLLIPIGKMSLVGPRPKMPDRYEPVGEHYSHTRTRIRQGCSCLWQVGIATHGLPNEAPEFDYFYLLHGSLRLDLWIAWKTGATLLGLSRPIELDDIPAWVQGQGWIEPQPA